MCQATITTAGPGNHRPNGPEANHALTIKLDHSVGVNHSTAPSGPIRNLSGRRPTKHFGAMKKGKRRHDQPTGYTLTKLLNCPGKQDYFTIPTASVADYCGSILAQHFLNLDPLPHGHGSLRPTFVFGKP